VSADASRWDAALLVIKGITGGRKGGDNQVVAFLGGNGWSY